MAVFRCSSVDTRATCRYRRYGPSHTLAHHHRLCERCFNFSLDLSGVACDAFVADPRFLFREFALDIAQRRLQRLTATDHGGSILNIESHRRRDSKAQRDEPKQRQHRSNGAMALPHETRNDNEAETFPSIGYHVGRREHRGSERCRSEAVSKCRIRQHRKCEHHDGRRPQYHDRQSAQRASFRNTTH